MSETRGQHQRSNAHGGSLVTSVAANTTLGRELTAQEIRSGVVGGDASVPSVRERRGSVGGLADVVARGSLAAAVSHAYIDRRKRLEQEAQKRDGGFAPRSDAVTAAANEAARAAAAAAAAEIDTDEDHVRAARAEAVRQYIVSKRLDVAAKLQALARVDPLTTRSFRLLCKMRDGHALGVYSAQYADDGNLVLSGSHDSTAVCWDITRQELKRTYRGHSGPVYSARWAPTSDNDRVLTASHDGTAKLWDKRSGRCVATLSGGHGGGPVYTAVWCGDGSMLATGGADAGIVVYDVERVTAVAARVEQRAYVAPIDMEERVLAHITPGVGAAADGDPAHTSAAAARWPPHPEGHTGPIRRLLFVPTHGNEAKVGVGRLLLSASDDGKVKLWDLSSPSGTLIHVFHGHAGPINDIAISPDGGKVLVTASSDGTAKLWSLDRGSVVHTLRGHVGAVYAALFTPEAGGRRVITGGHDRCICVWNVHSGSLLSRMVKVHLSWVLGLDVRVDGLQIISASGDRTVGVWRAQSLSIGAALGACVIDAAARLFSAMAPTSSTDGREKAGELVLAERGSAIRRASVLPQTGGIRGVITGTGALDASAGEALYDATPHGACAGGASHNTACHATRRKPHSGSRAKKAWSGVAVAPIPFC